MNILLWGLQVVLALHTVTGAVWKFSNAAQSVPSLAAIPQPVWLALSAIEVLCSVGLILPAIHRPLAVLAPIAAAIIAAEMLLFSGLGLVSSATDYGHLVYWLVVAAVCAFIVYGRWLLKPL